MTSRRITQFSLEPGQILADKYVIEEHVGSGWEGEVYRVHERKTGVRRAVKLFFPHRNRGDVAVKVYAKKLERLKRSDIVIQYHHSETLRLEGQRVTCLVSEYAEGPLLGAFLRQQPGGRLHAFEALHLTHALAAGLEQIHRVGVYHGDLHEANVLVRREGIFYRPKLVDFYHRGVTRREHMQNDVLDVVRLLYDAVGGKRHYATQPSAVKAICRGLRNDLVRRVFPSAAHLRRHLESFSWK
jgi:serine/threonine protein kinase